MFVDCRIDLPGMSAAFVAVLVLGIVLVMCPAAQGAVLQDGGWLLPAAALLAAGTRTTGRRGR
jgi:hypothetical protein